MMSSSVTASASAACSSATPISLTTLSVSTSNVVPIHAANDNTRCAFNDSRLMSCCTSSSIDDVS